jgi:hypothetical protein
MAADIVVTLIVPAAAAAATYHNRRAFFQDVIFVFVHLISTPFELEEFKLRLAKGLF